MSTEDKESGESEKLERVCSKMDELSLQMLCLMREYIDCKVKTEDLMKSGSLHLAKSRYIMGNRSVSALQLPTEEVTALTRVSRADTTEGAGVELRRVDLRPEPPSSEGLKSRSASAPAPASSSGKTPRPGDPLKWFGVLVPQNLRHAQSYFDKAVDYVVQCANIQLEMDSTRRNFDRLRATKKALLDAETDKEKKDV